MYSRFFRRLLTPMLSSAFIGLTAVVVTPTLISNRVGEKLSLFGKIECLETVRANKPEIIKLISKAQKQMIILIYNRESQTSLRQAILKIEQLAQQVGIEKIVLVDQTDVRHLQTFTRMIRKDVEEDEKKQGRMNQPVNLEGKIKIMYVSPKYDTNKPFMIQSTGSFVQQISQIRNFLRINPTDKELRESLQTYNCTTVVKICMNKDCADVYAEKVRQLIDLEFLKDKSENYAFFVTNAKNEASKIAGVVNQTSNKQEVYVFRNDMLGKSRDLQSDFKEKEGANYEISNQFMMMIRPRVHILSKKSLNTDLYWYISSLRSNPVPTFSINNTLNNLPIRIIQQPDSTDRIDSLIWLKGHPEQVQLMKRIKQKYGKKIEILILETNLPSQLIRHVYQPERYCIFSISPTVPYPKLLIKPPILNIPYSSWVKLEKIDSQDTEAFKQKNYGESRVWNQQRWSRVMDKINQFMTKSQNYTSVKMYRQKQMEINASEFQKMLEKKSKQKYILRVCGPTNNCLYSAYEKYGIGIQTVVYKLDAEVQNIDIKQGDYEVEGSSITPIQ